MVVVVKKKKKKKKVTKAKILPNMVNPLIYSWENARRRRMVNPRDIAGNAEEEDEW